MKSPTIVSTESAELRTEHGRTRRARSCFEGLLRHEIDKCTNVPTPEVRAKVEGMSIRKVSLHRVLTRKDIRNQNVGPLATPEVASLPV
jgi:hypothetical protein